MNYKIVRKARQSFVKGSLRYYRGKMNYHFHSVRNASGSSFPIISLVLFKLPHPTPVGWGNLIAELIAF